MPLYGSLWPRSAAAGKPALGGEAVRAPPLLSGCARSFCKAHSSHIQTIPPLITFRCGRRGHAARLANQLSTVMAVRAPPLLAELRAYFLDSSALSANLPVPSVVAARAFAAAPCGAAALGAGVGGRSSSEDSAGGRPLDMLLDTEDEPSTPPLHPTLNPSLARQLASKQAGQRSGAAGSCSAKGKSGAGPGAALVACPGVEEAGGCKAANAVPEGAEAGGKAGEAGSSRAMAAVQHEGGGWDAGKASKAKSGASGAERHWLWLTFRDRKVEARFRVFQATQLAKARSLAMCVVGRRIRVMLGCVLMSMDRMLHDSCSRTWSYCCMDKLVSS